MTYKQRQRTAKQRDIPFTLTTHQHAKLSRGPCAYCNGDSLGGIDRVDPSLGYSFDNCVPACKRCNARKSIYESLGPEKAVDKAIELAHRNETPQPSKREWRVYGAYRWVRTA